MAASTKTWVNNQAPSCEDDDLNGFKNENNNLIISSGQSLSTSDNQQTNKAVATYAAVGEFFSGGGIADAYTLTAPSPRVAPPALINGMKFRAVFNDNNTGACTVNPFGLGVIDIKLKGGATDPSAGDITADEEVTFIYRAAPSAHAELVISDSGADTRTRIDYTGIRFVNVTYTNSSDVTRQVFIQRGAAGSDTSLLVGGIDLIGATVSASTTITFDVLPGETYRYNSSVAALSWVEVA